MSAPRIAFTPGEPAGIGPDLAVALAGETRDYDLIAFADPQLLEQRARQLGSPLRCLTVDPGTVAVTRSAAELAVVPFRLAEPAAPGQLNPANSDYVVTTLTAAVNACRNGSCDALVTGPVHKGIINDAGIPFSGHTELLATLTATQRVVMMLATPGLRVALATTHLPLRQVADAIDQTSLLATLRILDRALRDDFGLSEPRLLVCGLNPHAGEGGYLGREEIEVIEPVLTQLRNEGMALEGPLPADTLFTPKVLQTGDAVLAMYHDQGLPVLKHLGFGNAVNITLGLPIIRTSVDHGTALDLAGSGRADPGSARYAIAVAREMVRHRREA